MEEIIYVKLLEEGTSLYRPVRASKLYNGLFKISDQPLNDDEVWQFGFNDIVKCVEAKLTDGEFLVAVEKKIIMFRNGVKHLTEKQK